MESAAKVRQRYVLRAHPQCGCPILVMPPTHLKMQMSAAHDVVVDDGGIRREKAGKHYVYFKTNKEVCPKRHTRLKVYRTDRRKIYLLDIGQCEAHRTFMHCH